MIKHSKIIFFISIFIVSNTTHASSKSFSPQQVSERINKSKLLFEYGDCQGVITILQDRSFQKSINNEEHLATIHKFLGICYYQLKLIKKAELEIKQLLYLRPKINLDPFLTPPSTIKFFEKIKKSQAEKLNTMLKKKIVTKKTKIAAIKLPKVKIDLKADKIIAEKYSKMSIFMPFGYNHLLREDYKSGILLASLQSISLAINIGAYWWKNSYINDYGQITSEKFKQAQKLQFISIGFFGVFYLYAVIDGATHLAKTKVL